jgi:hypothetical protein
MADLPCNDVLDAFRRMHYIKTSSLFDQSPLLGEATEGERRA